MKITDELFVDAITAAASSGPLEHQSVADIIPIASRRPCRSKKQLVADVHNAGLRMVYNLGASAQSRRYAELWQRDQCIARDPLPTMYAQDDEGLLTHLPVELPGPNCLDAMSVALDLTEKERAEFRTRREDAATLLAEYAAAKRGEIERLT